MRRARRRTTGRRAPRRSSRPPPPASCRRSPRTSARRRHAAAAWSATGAPPRRGKVRSTGYSRIRRDVRRDVPPTAAAASPPVGAARDGSPASPAVVADPSPWPAAAGTDAIPAPHRSDPQAVANSSRPAVPAACSRLPPSPRSTGWPRSCVWTCRRHEASARRVSCAWVISVQACPAPSQREPRQCRFADHPTAPVTPVHSLVAIARNGWSRSIGTPGRNQLESVVAISRCAQSRADRRARTPCGYDKAGHGRP